MDLKLNKKIALITGASKGLGLGTAQRLAEEGCDLHLVARNENDLLVAKDKILAKHNVSVSIHPGDLSKRNTAQSLLEQCSNINILVNNAGAIPGGNLWEIEDETWRSAWDLKVFGYIDMCRHAYRNMKSNGSGIIINIIGAAGSHPDINYITGGTGNAALMAFTTALGATSLDDGIRVVGINPGYIFTERLENLLRGRAEKELGDADKWKALLDNSYPPGKIENIADMCAFLASGLSSNTTGTIINVDGGFAARGTNARPI